MLTEQLNKLHRTNTSFLNIISLLPFQYVENVSKWSQGCEMSATMSTTTDIAALESTIHHHQSLYENMCQSYTEVHSTSKKLLYQLDHLVQMCSAAQTSDERKHVSDLGGQFVLSSVPRVSFVSMRSQFPFRQIRGCPNRRKVSLSIP